MESNLRIIVLVELPADRDQIQRELVRQQMHFTAWPVSSEGQLQIAVKEFRPHVIIGEWSFPKCDGITALGVARRERTETPFLLLTKNEAEERAAGTLKAPMTDWMPKGQWSGLGAVLRSLMRELDADKRRRETESALRLAEGRFQTLWEKTPDGMRLTDSQGRILMVNEVFCRLTERPREALEGQSLACVFDATHQGRVLQEYSQRMADRSFGAPGHLDAVLWNGTAVSLGVMEFLIEAPGSAPQVLALFRTGAVPKADLDSHALLAQRMECIGTLADGVAHDLNNILTPMLLAIPMLRWESPPPEYEAALQMIENGAKRGSEIVRQLQSFRKSEPGTRSAIQCRHLLNDVAKILEETFPKDVVLTHSAPTDLWVVQGDPMQVQQVLMNLCLNARDAMPAGGEVRLTADNVTVEPREAALFPGAKPGPHVRLQVRDTGQGIPSDKLGSIFDPFFTTRTEHAGLGLTVTLGIVKSHGGFIKVQSEIGVGTLFEVYLPVAVEPLPAARKEPDKNSAPQGHGEVILIVEDEEDIRVLTEKILKKLGYEVLSAANGVEALAIFEKRRDDIKVVLTDLVMPKMDGVALVRHLREHGSDVRIIVLTGAMKSVRPDSGMNSLSGMQVSFFLTKPFTVNQVLIALHTAINTEVAAIPQTVAAAANNTTFQTATQFTRRS